MRLNFRTMHRFLVEQLIYPIALSTIFAMSIFVGRVILSHNIYVYRNLVWNMVLAWLPYLFSMWAVRLAQAQPGKWWLLVLPGAAWLAFLPNAPYMLTDFFHLELRPPVPIWYDIGLLAAFSWTGIFLAIVSLRNMHLLVEHFLGWIVGWVFALGSLGLCGLGLYLGRFSRWNSWDLLIQPRQILAEIATVFFDPLNNPRFFGFIFMFTTLLVVIYLMFISIQHFSPLKNQNK